MLAGRPAGPGGRRPGAGWGAGISDEFTHRFPAPVLAGRPSY